MDLYLQVQKPTLAPYPTHGWGTKLTKNSVGDGFVGCLDRFYFIGRLNRSRRLVLSFSVGHHCTIDSICLPSLLFYAFFCSAFPLFPHLV